MDYKSLKKALEQISATMDDQRDYLISLDQQNGDGDLGISMSEGYRAVKGLRRGDRPGQAAAQVQLGLQ